MSRAQLTSTVEQNSAGAAAPFLAGKNKIINGDFGIWQRGTSFSNPAAGTFVADRFYLDYSGTIGTTTISQQTTPTVIATGIDTASFLQWSSTVAGSSQTYNVLSQKIENVATLADQLVTFSFYAKASSSTALSQIYLHQNFGSGGSSEIYYNLGSATITTSWARYSFTTTLGSISGKTIGAGSFLRAFIGAPLNSTFTISTWGWQVEAGSVATPFTTATGTVQGELAVCQRYYQTNSRCGYIGNTTVSNSYYQQYTFVVLMRAAPTVVLTSIAANLFSTTTTAGAISADTMQLACISNATGSAGYFINSFTASAEL
jgi:hypothetical protein